MPQRGINMPSTAGGIAQLVRGMCSARAPGMTDGQLLRKFLSERDESAFAALVERHGPMVLGVCRRVLGNAADAEDAFQAAFLVLARHASSLARLAARRRAKERAMARSQSESATGRDDWLPLLDEELEKLPADYRLPIVLCDLEGHTRREAAARLGWPEGTVAGRLSRARALLAERLARRGVALSAGAVAAALSQGSVPAALVAFTVKAAVRGAISAPVAALTQEVVKTMFLSKLKAPVAGALAALACAALGYAVLAGTRPGDDKRGEAAVVERDQDDEKPAGPRADAVDQFGDPCLRRRWPGSGRSDSSTAG
jgi:RNA polymerase sigma factor (sigma-70 family)